VLRGLARGEESAAPDVPHVAREYFEQGDYGKALVILRALRSATPPVADLERQELICTIHQAAEKGLWWQVGGLFSFPCIEKG
jgi:hypothetical protein